MSLGIELNNPGNLRRTSTVWRGQDLSYEGAYCKFEAPEWGLRALAKTLMTYESDGIKTLRVALSRYAPPEENDTAAYLMNVCGWCGIDADTTTTLAQLPILRAIIRQEQGEQPYPDSLILLGMSLAKPTPES